MLTHTGERPFVCPVDGCYYRCTKKSKIGLHIRAMHRQKNRATTNNNNNTLNNDGGVEARAAEALVCGLDGGCRFWTFSKRNLTVHRAKVHTQKMGGRRGGVEQKTIEKRNEKEPASTSKSTGMSTQQQRERPFACSVEGCAYRAKAKSQVTIHLRTHTGEKPYGCTVGGCGYRASQKNNLKRHLLRVHNNVWSRRGDERNQVKISTSATNKEVTTKKSKGSREHAKEKFVEV